LQARATIDALFADIPAGLHAAGSKEAREIGGGAAAAKRRLRRLAQEP